MNAKLTTGLDEIAIRQVEAIKGLAVGGELHQSAIEDLSTTCAIIQDIEKNNREALAAKREYTRDTIIKYLEAGVAVGTLSLGFMQLKSKNTATALALELEQTGSMTIQTLRWLMQGFIGQK